MLREADFSDETLSLAFDANSAGDFSKAHNTYPSF